MLAKGLSADPSPSWGAAADTVSVSAWVAEAASRKTSGATRRKRLIAPDLIANLHEFRVMLVLISDLFLQFK